MYFGEKNMFTINLVVFQIEDVGWGVLSMQMEMLTPRNNGARCTSPFPVD